MRLFAACAAALAFVVYVSGCCCCGPGIPSTTGGTTVAAPSPAFGATLPKLAPTTAVVASTSHTQQF